MEKLTLQEVIKLAVTIEEVAVKVYQQLARKFSTDGEIGPVFEELARDEGGHARYFSTLLERTTDAPVSAIDQATYARGTVIAKVFKEAGLNNARGIETAVDALTKAYELERSTLRLYKGLRSEIGASPELDELIAAEHAHVAALLRVITANAKFRGIADAQTSGF